jgi:hypothetical protein
VSQSKARKENRVLRKVFGTKMEEVAGDWRRLHNVELHNVRFNKYLELLNRGV